MRMPHEVHCYDYVNQPYERVRREVLADPHELFRKATSGAHGTQLHVRIGSLELGAEISIEIRGVEEKRTSAERPTTTLTLDWRSKRSAALFPIMTAGFAFYPLNAKETQVELNGRYDPPLGALADAIDAVALHRFAQSSAQGFVREIATYLRRTLNSNHASM
jgi:hypothetical protein